MTITQSSKNPPMIRLSAVRKSYGHFEVLKGIDAEVARGEVVVVCGPSGSGKSTLIRTVNRLEEIASGSITCDGNDMHGSVPAREMNRLRSRIGFVFQSFNLVPRTSALANVELPLAYAGLKGAKRRHRAERALKAVGMGNRMQHLPSELSGGQQQRVAVARAIVTNPSLILADEPTGNLDSRSTDEVLRIFTRLNDEQRTVVLITHEPDVAERARRIIRLSDGQIAEDRTIAPVTLEASA